MTIKTLAALAQPDERSLAGLVFKTDPEKASEYLQKQISSLELAEQVPETTRSSFDRLRTIYTYGILCYDLYTVAGDQARLILEQALRERFLPFYSGTVTFADANKEDHDIPADKFSDLFDALRKDGRLRRPHRWRLKLRSGKDPIYFDGMLDSLLRWARAEGLLGGQRDRVRDRSRLWFRNYVAHPTYHLQDAGHAMRAINDLAHIINRIWGADPGMPVRREPMVIAWTEDTTITGLAQYFTGPVPPTAPHVVVLADPEDPDLLDFDAQYAITVRPCDYLWGPGTWEEAAAWLQHHQPTGDHAQVLDRLFLLRYHGNRLYLPRTPAITAGLPDDQRPGTWYLLRADSPIDAFSHQRQALAGTLGHQLTGPCQCPVETITAGTWQETLDRCAELGADTSPRTAPDARPHIARTPRWNESSATANGPTHRKHSNRLTTRTRPTGR
jgi:hypothetical protein